MMTTRADWEFRANYLRGTAMRLKAAAAQLNSEVKALLIRANECDREAVRLDKLEQK